MRNLFVNHYGEARAWVVISIIATMVATFIVGLIVLVCSLSLVVGKRTCASWSREMGIPTKFVRLNFADTGTCLAQTPDGRWVLNTRVQVYIPGGRR